MNKTLLQEEIVNEFTDLKKMELGTDTYSNTVEGLSKLLKQSTELEQYETDRLDKLAQQEEQIALQRAQLKSDRWHKVATVGVAICTGLLTAGLNVWGTKTSLKFEEEGKIVTTLPGRKFMDKLFKN